MTLLIKWLFGSDKKSEDNDYALSSARREKKRAESEHEEVVELIQLLEVENKLNHYAEMVESALRGTRKG